MCVCRVWVWADFKPEDLEDPVESGKVDKLLLALNDAVQKSAVERAAKVVHLPGKVMDKAGNVIEKAITVTDGKRRQSSQAEHKTSQKV